MMKQKHLTYSNLTNPDQILIDGKPYSLEEFYSYTNQSQVRNCRNCGQGGLTFYAYGGPTPHTLCIECYELYTKKDQKCSDCNHPINTTHAVDCRFAGQVVQYQTKFRKCERCNTQIPGDLILCENCFNLAKQRMAENMNIPITQKPSSSYVPSLHLIPFSALECLADRFELGARVKEQPWNAMSNVNTAKNVEFVKERLVHVICHAYSALNRLNYLSEQDIEEINHIWGDAGAILFGGALLAEYLSPRAKEKENA